MAATYDESSFFDYVQSIRQKYGIEPFGYSLLVAMWLRPKETKTAGGIILTDRTLDEDKWQGKIAKVLAIGPDAYKSDQVRQFSGPWCAVGDWVVIPKSEHVSRLFEVEGMAFAFLNDDRVLGRVGTVAVV